MINREKDTNKKRIKYVGYENMQWDEFLPKIDVYARYEKNYSEKRLALILKGVSLFRQELSLPVTLDESRRLIGEKRRAGHKPSYVNSLIDSLLVVVRCAMSHDIGQEDITGELNGLRKRTIYKPKADDLLSIDEVKQILAYRKKGNSELAVKLDMMYHLLYGFLYRTACRQGEARILRKKNFNFPNHSVTFYDTKTGEDRTVAVPPDMEEELLVWTKDMGDSEYLFTSYTDKSKPLCEDSVNRMFKTICKRVGIERSVHVHMLRHSCISHLLINGAPMAVVQAIVGHRNFKTTQLYTHILVGNQREAMLKFNPIIKTDDPYTIMKLVRDFIQDLKPDTSIFELTVDDSLRTGRLVFGIK